MGTGRKLAGVRVLLVDDDVDSLDTFCVLLELEGAEPRGVMSARQGLDALDGFRPHVLMFDLSMPEEDGYTLIARVRALPPERGGLTPAVALTARAYAQDRERALQCGFQRYVCKPAEPARLIDVLAEVAGAHVA